jgi:hypothetical protein
MEASGQPHGTAALPAGKEPRYLLDRLLSGSQSRSGRCWAQQIFLHSRNQTPAVQRIVSRYADWAVRLCLLLLLLFYVSEIVIVMIYWAYGYAYRIFVGKPLGKGQYKGPYRRQGGHAVA